MEAVRVLRSGMISLCLGNRVNPRYVTDDLDSWTLLGETR